MEPAEDRRETRLPGQHGHPGHPAAIRPAVERREHADAYVHRRDEYRAAMEPAAERREHPGRRDTDVRINHAAAMEPAARRRDTLLYTGVLPQNILPQWSESLSDGSTPNFLDSHGYFMEPQWSLPPNGGSMR
jgi:hypothetical protein